MTRRTRKGPTAPVGRGSIRDLAELQELGEELARPGATGARDAAESTVMPPATGVSGSGFTAGTSTWLDRITGVSSAISGELDLDRLARTILEQLLRLLQADRGILFLGRPDAAGLVPIFAVDVAGEELQEISRVSRTILGRARAGELVITGNAPADARFSTIRSIRLNEMRSIICGPLVSPSGIVGALYLDAVGAHAFAEPANEFFRAMAGIAAVALEKAIVHGELIRENRELRDQLRDRRRDRLPDHAPGHFRESSTESAATGATIGSIVGAGEAIERLRHQMLVAARLDGPVLLVGEPGTGRRTLARAIHQASRRLGQPFVVFDFDAIPPDHHRSVLMGRTGPAVKTYPHPEPGMVRQAEPGSLYLAGVESLPPELAPSITRLGEKGVFRPLGSRRDEQANIRLFVARTEIPTGRAGSGETGGWSRVAQWFHLVVPPLRERSEDIPDLATRCAIELIGAAAGPTARPTAKPTPKPTVVPIFTTEALDRLSRHPWPGNLRELRHAIQRMLLVAPRLPIAGSTVEEVLASSDVDSSATLGPWSGEIRPMREWEDEAIRQALRKTDGNKAAAARLLGLHRNTIVMRTKGEKKG